MEKDMEVGKRPMDKRGVWKSKGQDGKAKFTPINEMDNDHLLRALALSNTKANNLFEESKSINTHIRKLESQIDFLKKKDQEVNNKMLVYTGLYTDLAYELDTRGISEEEAQDQVKKSKSRKEIA